MAGGFDGHYSSVPGAAAAEAVPVVRRGTSETRQGPAPMVTGRRCDGIRGAAAEARAAPMVTDRRCPGRPSGMAGRPGPSGTGHGPGG